jgi:3D (Asp-Asp-Asp) domain-containing protein
MNRSACIAAVLAGLLVVLGLVKSQPVHAAEAEPTKKNHSTIPTPTGTPLLAQCLGCEPLPARVIFSSYDPRKYDPQYPKLNCWEYSLEHNYCLSPTWIGVPWESGWNLFAACPAIWGVGTWVDVPGRGARICMDHGGDITCDESTGVCRVDLLGPALGALDGQVTEVTLWVPKSYLLRLARK